jgi:hypothetical protein
VGIAKALYVGLAANIAGGVDKLTSATGVVSVAAATAPTTGQVLMATSGTVATWQTVATPSAATPTALGTVYGKTNTTNLTFLGYGAGNVNTGTYNTFVGGLDDYYGISTGGSNTSGNFNTAVGSGSIAKNVTGSNITSVGMDAGQNTTAGPNSYFGLGAGNGNTSGTGNVAVGYRTLGYTGAGGACSNNVCVGDSSLTYNTTGGSNVAVGGGALLSNTTASNNTAVGYQSGYSITTGTYNTFLGYQAGTSATTNYNSIYIGYGTTASSAGIGYELVIGTGVTGKGSTTGFINLGGGGVYQGNNSTLWSVTSDQRLKKNIVDNNVGLEKITAIQVRNFEYRLPEEVGAKLKPTDAIKKEGVQLGVIAQELQLVLPECVKTESTGVMSVNADNLTWYMVNAIKELKAEFDAYKSAHP